MSRPFRGLRERPPAPAYDAVVIGAGIGGLITANLLAKSGLSVLLAEQHYMVGGYCSTFRRAGYTFDAATHFYPLLGNPETLTGRLLAEIGVTTGWVKMDPVDTFHFPDGSRFAVPADLDVYLAKLKAEFPAEAAALDAFFLAVRETYLLGLMHYFRGRPPRQGERFTVRAGAVVANGDLLLTLERLIGREHLRPGTLEGVRKLRPTFPCFLIHIGLAGVPDDVLEAAQGYYWDSWDMDRVGRDALRFKLFAPTLYEPAMAPAGGQIIIIQKVLEMDYDAVVDWPAHKRRIEELALGHLERVIPGIGRRIVVQTSASARTAERFTLNYQGAMLGG